MTRQNERQASVRAVTGTAYSYNDDWRALFDQAGIAAGNYNDRLRAWINDRLGTSYVNVNDAMRAFAVDQGFTRWDEMGTLDAAGGIFLDLTAGALPDGMTATGGANGTRINSSGLLVSASAPRFDYDPVTLASRGLLVEPGRTTLLTDSGALASGWTASGASRTANQAVSPDGGTNMSLLTEAGVLPQWYQIGKTITSGSAHAGSVYFRAKEATFGVLNLYDTGNANRRAWFDLSTGTVGTVQSGLTARIENAGNGLYRAFVTGTAGSNSGGLSIEMGTADNSNAVTVPGGGLYAWGAQHGIGSDLGSYIPTTSGSVTRSADSIKISADLMADVTGLRFTFDDDTTQDVVTTPDAEYTIPTNLNRSRIKYIESV